MESGLTGWIIIKKIRSKKLIEKITTLSEFLFF